VLVDVVLVDARSMRTKVQQLTGPCKAVNNVGSNAAVAAGTLNDHYAAISDDVNYSAP
jgi:hypothetical protein